MIKFIKNLFKTYEWKVGDVYEDQSGAVLKLTKLDESSFQFTCLKHAAVKEGQLIIKGPRSSLNAFAKESKLKKRDEDGKDKK